MRERGASSGALPPLYFRCTFGGHDDRSAVSRAAILASLLPAYPTVDDGTYDRSQSGTYRKRFPTFNDYETVVSAADRHPR